MSLSELIAKVGDANIAVQTVAESMSNIQLTKKGKATAITFITNEINPLDFMSNTGKVGLIIWLPRDKVPK